MTLTLLLTTDPNPNPYPSPDPNKAARLFRALAPRPITRLELCCDEPAALKRELGALFTEQTLTLTLPLTPTLSPTLALALTLTKARSSVNWGASTRRSTTGWAASASCRTVARLATPLVLPSHLVITPLLPRQDPSLTTPPLKVQWALTDMHAAASLHALLCSRPSRLSFELAPPAASGRAAVPPLPVEPELPPSSWPCASRACSPCI